MFEKLMKQFFHFNMSIILFIFILLALLKETNTNKEINLI